MVKPSRLKLSIASSLSLNVSVSGPGLKRANQISKKTLAVCRRSEKRGEIYAPKVRWDLVFF